MAPANSALSKKKRRQPETGPPLRASVMKKSSQASSVRKSLRLQNESQVPPTPQPTRAQPIPTPFVPISQAACTKRKASRDSKAKADGPEGPSELPQEPPLLSEKDSQSLQSLYKEVMESVPKKSLKRILSQYTTT